MNSFPIISKFSEKKLNRTIDITGITTMVYVPTDKLIIATEKGKRCLIYEGYIYYVNRQTDTTTTWRCEKNKSNKCKGRLCQKGDDYVDVKEHPIDTPHGHNHASDHSRAEGRIAKSSMYAQSTVPGLSARTVWNTIAATTSAGGILNVPNLSSFSRSMSRKRKLDALPLTLKKQPKMHFEQCFLMSSCMVAFITTVKVYIEKLLTSVGVNYT